MLLLAIPNILVLVWLATGAVLSHDWTAGSLPPQGPRPNLGWTGPEDMRLGGGWEVRGPYRTFGVDVAGHRGDSVILLVDLPDEERGLMTLMRVVHPPWSGELDLPEDVEPMGAKLVVDGNLAAAKPCYLVSGRGSPHPGDPEEGDPWCAVVWLS